MFSDYGCAKGTTYVRYSSKAPELGIEMDYPADWACIEREDTKTGYANVLFFEPGKGQHLKATIMVTAKKISTLRPELVTLDSFLGSVTSTRMKSKDAKILSKTLREFLDLPALEALMSYQTLDEIYAVKAKLLPVKERIIVFQRKDTFYIVRYRNKEEDFGKVDKVFTHCIETLKFKATP